MKVIKINNLMQNFNDEKKPLIAIWGFFDGWHLGHQALLEQMQDLAKKYHYQTLVISFNVKPQSVLLKKDIPILLNIQDKQDFLMKKHIDYCYHLIFTEEVANVSAEEFINFLLINKVVAVVSSRDIHFGSQEKGNLALLQKSPLKVFISKEIFDEDNNKISSTYIKKLLLNKNINHANRLLYSDYTITGKVVDGVKEGRTLGFPTANLALTDNYVIPGVAVYITLTKVDDKWYQSLTVIIIRDNKPLIESYLLSFNKNIYGKIIKIRFLTYLRDNRFFSNKENLINQIKKDIINANVYFENKNVA